MPEFNGDAHFFRFRAEIPFHILKALFVQEKIEILELYIFKFHDVIKCLSVKQEIRLIE